MKNNIIIIIAITAVLAVSACSTTGRAVNGESAVLLKKTTYLNAPFDSKKLSSADEYLMAIKDNEALNIEWNRDFSDDRETSTVYSYQTSFYEARKVKLIGDLYRNFPDTPELKELMLERFEFSKIVYQLDIIEEIRDYEEIYAGNKDNIEKAWYFYYDGIIFKNYRKEQPILSALFDFDKMYPESEYAENLYKFAHTHLRDTPSQEKVAQLIAQRFPDSPETARIESDQKRSELVGSPFELKFTDIITKEKIDLNDWKGHLVVVDFWATWCGPCVGEIPEMKRIYNEYHSKGVEFLGVSFDQDTAKLKKYCSENDVPWPQYCIHANGGDPAFGEKWYISGIPTVFILDRTGKIYSVKARGNVEKLLNELL